MNNVEYDRSNPRPTVLIVGEYLLNFHPGANRDIEAVSYTHLDVYKRQALLERLA